MINAGIYIHIPFCKAKCMYCDFYSITKQGHDMNHFVEMLLREIKQKAQDHGNNWIFDTIFFGGGTPSLLKPLWIENILTTLNSCFDISKIKEITLEVNPGEIKLNDLIKLRKAGINRLSIGFQSLQPELLKFLSRIHNPEDNFKTFKNARQAGFENINIDLIFNIPEQTLKVWEENLKQIMKLNPEHISAYSLTVEPNTMLHNKVLDGTITMPVEEIDLEMFELCQKYLNDNNYIQYEISNYAKEGMQCQHNLHYWNLEPYLAFGPSAHGHDGEKRWWNVSSLDVYMQKMKKKQNPLGGIETLNAKDHFNEIVFNGIRTKNGIQLKKLNQWNQHSNELNTTIKKWTEKLTITKNSIRLKRDSYKFADEIASDMMQSTS